MIRPFPSTFPFLPACPSFASEALGNPSRFEAFPSKAVDIDILGTGTEARVSSIKANSLYDEALICCSRVSRTPSPFTVSNPTKGYNLFSPRPSTTIAILQICQVIDRTVLRRRLHQCRMPNSKADNRVNLLVTQARHHTQVRHFLARNTTILHPTIKSVNHIARVLPVATDHCRFPVCDR